MQYFPKAVILCVVQREMRWLQPSPDSEKVAGLTPGWDLSVWS